ncbi:MAG: rRNA maturation RNase YbeY [Elusimicrobiaceae bacterium]|nr:rRNA maturation RNase YbeY [Elusimicrobiaceae bacterium]
MQINIFYKTKISPYYHKTGIYKKALLRALGKQAKTQSELNVFVVTPQEMLKINTQHLGHRYVTDVITFPYPQTGLKGEVFGDIIVCFEQAKKQAPEAKTSTLLEFLILMVHGALHLVGYDDNTLELRNQMNTLARSIAEQALNS